MPNSLRLGGIGSGYIFMGTMFSVCAACSFLFTLYPSLSGPISVSLRRVVILWTSTRIHKDCGDTKLVTSVMPRDAP